MCEVVVESFILNPIRKMVGLATGVMRKIVGSFAAGELLREEKALDFGAKTQ
jgi:tRNA U38,U39,U40 pseudouridine synthase TruA